MSIVVNNFFLQNDQSSSYKSHFSLICLSMRNYIALLLLGVATFQLVSGFHLPETFESEPKVQLSRHVRAIVDAIEVGLKNHEEQKFLRENAASYLKALEGFSFNVESLGVADLDSKGERSAAAEDEKEKDGENEGEGKKKKKKKNKGKKGKKRGKGKSTTKSEEAATTAASATTVASGTTAASE